MVLTLRTKTLSDTCLSLITVKGRYATTKKAWGGCESPPTQSKAVRNRVNTLAMRNSKRRMNRAKVMDDRRQPLLTDLWTVKSENMRSMNIQVKSLNDQQAQKHENTEQTQILSSPEAGGGGEEKF